MNFSKWTKPGTNETRIYINGVSVNGKPFIVDTDGRWEVKCFGLYQSQLDELSDRVESALADLNCGERFSEFSRVIELVK